MIEDGEILNIQYSQTARKHIKNLDENQRVRIRKAIEKIPLGDIKKLCGYSNQYRLRIGDYRVIYSLVQNGILISAILPRGSVYKNF